MSDNDEEAVEEKRPDRCGRCLYWELVDDDDVREFGLCRGGPPSVLGAPGGEIHCSFPITPPNEWCGAFRSKP